MQARRWSLPALQLGPAPQACQLPSSQKASMLPRGAPHTAGGSHSTGGACRQAGPLIMWSLLQTNALLRNFPVQTLAPS